jgi:hypothetical protein
MTDIIQTITLEGVEDVVSGFGSIGKSGEQAFEGVTQATEKASEAIGGVAEGLGKAASVGGKALGELGEPIHAIAEGFVSMASSSGTFLERIGLMATAVTGVVAALGFFAEKMAESVFNTQRLADAIGIEVADLEQLKFAFANAGVPAENMRRTFAALISQMEKTAAATDPAATALGRLGINVGAIGNLKNPIEVLKEVADRIAAIPNPANQAAAAIDVFGRRFGPQLLPLLKQGGDAIQAAMDKAKQLGLVLPEELQKTAGQVYTSFLTMQQVVENFAERIGLTLAPALKIVFDEFTKLLGDNRAKFEEWAKVVGEKASSVAQGLVDFIEGKEVKDDWVQKAIEGFNTLKTAIEGVTAAMKLLKLPFDAMAGVIDAVFGTKVTGTDLAIGLAIARVTGVLGGALTAFNALRTGIGLFIAVLPALTGGIIAIGEAIAVAFVTNPLGIFLVALGAIVVAVLALSGAFDKASDSSKKSAEDSKSGWQSFLDFMSGIGQKIVDAWNWVVGQVTNLWNGLVSMAGSVWGAVKDAIVGAGNGIVNIWNGIVQGIKDAWQGLVDGVQGIWDSITQAAQQAADGLVQLWNNATSAVGNFFQDLFNKAKGYFDGILGWIRDAISQAASFLNLLPGMGNQTPEGGAPMFAAGGGHIRGPGTSTSDSIFAFLSNDEFVMKAAAVRRYGVGMMSAINNMTFPRFAAGGLVQMASHSSSPRHVLNLTIGGEHFGGLLVPEQTASRLSQFAVSRQLSSAGRKPRWVR